MQLGILTNTDYFNLQNLIIDPLTTIEENTPAILSFLKHGNINTFEFLISVMESTINDQIWKIPSLLHLFDLVNSKGFPYKLVKTGLIKQYFETSLKGSTHGVIPFLDDSLQSPSMVSILEALARDSPADITESMAKELRVYCIKFRAFNVIQKFNLKFNQRDSVVACKCFTKDEYLKYFPWPPMVASRLYWVYEVNTSLLEDPLIWKEINKKSIVLPTPIAVIYPNYYAPSAILEIVRKELFGVPYLKNYNRVVSFINDFFDCEKLDFESLFEMGLLNKAFETAANMLRFQPRHCEYVVHVLKCLNKWINKGRFLQLANSSYKWQRILAFFVIKIGCDYRSDAGLEKDWMPYSIVKEQVSVDERYQDALEVLFKEREMLFDPRFVCGFGYSIFEDNLQEFIEEYDYYGSQEEYFYWFKWLPLEDICKWLGSWRIFEYLKLNGKAGNGALRYAVYGDNVKLMKDIIKENAKIDPKAIRYAINVRKFGIVEYVLEMEQIEVKVNLYDYVPIWLLIIMPGDVFFRDIEYDTAVEMRDWLDVMTYVLVEKVKRK